jgi:hypothetical protein
MSKQKELSTIVTDWIKKNSTLTGKSIDQVTKEAKKTVYYAIQQVRNQHGLTNFLSLTPTPDIPVTLEETTDTPDVPVTFDAKPYTPTIPFPLSRIPLSQQLTPMCLSKYDIIQEPTHLTIEDLLPNPEMEDETDPPRYQDTRILVERTPVIDTEVYSHYIEMSDPDVEYANSIYRALTETPISLYPPNHTPNSTDYGAGLIKALTTSTIPPKPNYHYGIAFYMTPTPLPIENEE